MPKAFFFLLRVPACLHVHRQKEEAKLRNCVHYEAEICFYSFFLVLWYSSSNNYHLRWFLLVVGIELEVQICQVILTFSPCRHGKWGNIYFPINTDSFQVMVPQKQNHNKNTEIWKSQKIEDRACDMLILYTHDNSRACEAVDHFGCCLQWNI